MDLDGLTRRAAALADTGSRSLLGITGPPGAGKSTLAQHLVARLGRRAVAVPMDGFHLAQQELVRLGRQDRKGAPDTFDAAGFVALLGRIRRAESVVYAPAFDRQQEQPLAGAIAITARVPLVVVEGNYLLLERQPWDQVRPLLDACWYVQLDEQVRTRRLTDRHLAHGRSVERAREWVARTDAPNAALVARTMDRADLVVRT